MRRITQTKIHRIPHGIAGVHERSRVGRNGRLPTGTGWRKRKKNNAKEEATCALREGDDSNDA